MFYLKFIIAAVIGFAVGVFVYKKYKSYVEYRFTNDSVFTEDSNDNNE